MDIAKIRKKINKEKESTPDTSAEIAEKNSASLPETVPSKPQADIQKIEKQKSGRRDMGLRRRGPNPGWDSNRPRVDGYD